MSTDYSKWSTPDLLKELRKASPVLIKAQPASVAGFDAKMLIVTMEGDNKNSSVDPQVIREYAIEMLQARDVLEAASGGK